MYFLVGRYLPFKVLNIRIKKKARGRIVAQVKRTDETGVEGKCSTKIFYHSWFFTHLSQAYSWIYFLDFIDTSIWFVFSLKEFTSKRLVKTFCFPAEKLKNGYLYHACSGCLMFTSLQHLFENGWIFPPKDLEKYGRPKYACAVFFFFFFQVVIFPAIKKLFCIVWSLVYLFYKQTQ